MHELIVNLHMHTPYSDGHGTHEEIAQAALQADLDVVIVTDHNIWVDGPEGYYRDGSRQVLLLVGEEIHDPNQQPSKNHLLVFGAGQELAPYGRDTQRLIEAANEAKGLAFLAHPCETDAPAIGEADHSWIDWFVHGYTGLELWNAMSEFKSRIRTKLHALYFALNPQLIARGPSPIALRKWDELLQSGKHVVAVGGTDAHAFKISVGPIRRTIFPYRFHFNTINTHIFTSIPLNGNLDHDRSLVLEALKKGRAFIGYDLPASTRGFRFTAQGKDGRTWMGDEISAHGGVTLQIRLPRRTSCHLLKNGQVIKAWRKREHCTHITNEPGVYRVEAYIHFYRQQRGWIYSNPIYVR